MISEKRKKRISFFSILFTFFVDMLGWCIVFPIFAPLFLDPQNVIFSHEISVTARTTILGFFLAAYPIAQFFGSPILGDMGDKYGRKKALILSVFLSFVGYALSAWSIHISSLYLLFFSRIITGLFSGNLSICMAAIADISLDEKAKIKNFSYISILAGATFVIGPYIGGRFSDKTINALFSPSLPLWFAASLCFVNFLFLVFAFYEMYKPHKHQKHDLLEGVHNISGALKIPKLKTIYIIYFLYLFAWVIIMQFVPVLVIQKFDFSNSQIGNLAAFMGVCWVVGSFMVQKAFLNKKSSLRILEVVLVFFTISCFIVFIPNKVSILILIVSLAMFACGIAWPICTSIISNMATQRMQGKVLGMSQSMQSLAMTIAPIVGGFVDHLFSPLTFLTAGLACLIASIIYFYVKP